MAGLILLDGTFTMTSSVLMWWSLLCVVSLVNVLVWTTSAALLWRRSFSFCPVAWAAIRVQIMLSGAYVFGCAFRSVLPVFDIQRLCLIDSWLSSAIVGRSVATMAELCFVAQLALLSRGIAQAADHRFGILASRAVVPMIFVAEIFSWYAVLTTSNLGHVIEESLWGICALMLAASCVHALPRIQREVRSALATFSALAVLYALYMFAVDVPMYWSRWTFDSAHGHPFLSLSQGLLDASSRWVVSHRWADWESEVLWMSAYFSVAVWISIGLVHLPHLKTLGSLSNSDHRTTPSTH